MAKFRSWDKRYNDFIYWENGSYFKFYNNEKRYCKSNSCSIVMFDWQNAEQNITTTDFYVGDKIKRFVTKDCWEECVICINEFGQIYIKGVLKNYDWVSNDDGEYYYKKTKITKSRKEYTNFCYINDFKEIGNIHEEG